MKQEPLHVKGVLRIKSEYQEEFERELMAIREKCMAEPERAVFAVERRSDDLTAYLSVETSSEPSYFETVPLKRDYYPPYFAKIDGTMAAAREIHYWARLAAYSHHSS